MRYLIVSDMHGNWDAFEAVLEHVKAESFDSTLVLGDLVGYGASPNEVVAALDGLPGKVWTVRGNHDKVVAGIDNGEHFNDAALAAARWTAESLAAEHFERVKELPQGPIEIAERTSICHGSPLDEDAYVFSDYDAFQIFSEHDADLVFFGHTHVPSLFAVGPAGLEVQVLHGSGEMDLVPGSRYLLNPGSVGQPRDRDPRAAYMIYESETRTLSWHRLAYPIEAAQARILEAGLPSVLAERLVVGI